MRGKSFLIILILSILIAIPVFSQPKKKIYVTLDTSGSMYGDKYMISNYTAQFIALVCSYDDVYMICNGLPKKISGDVNAFKQIQFDYSLIRSKWGVSPIGTQIGDIATFNSIFDSNYDGEQWLFIIGDGNWESYKFPKIIDKFTGIVKSGKVKVFFIPYGNVTDGRSDFIDYLHTLNTPKILNGSRDVQNVMGNCIIILSYLTGNSAKNIELSLINNKTIKAISPLGVKKYMLFYQDATDDKNISLPASATQDTTHLKLDFLGTPTTSLLRYKDNQTLVSGTIWEISADKKMEADIPVIVSFNKNINIKKLKLFPVYDLGLNTETNYLKVTQTNNNLNITPITFSRTDSAKNEITQTIATAIPNLQNPEKENLKTVSGNKKSEKQVSKPEKTVTLSESKTTTVKLKKVKNKDSVSVYTATVKVKEKIDTTKFDVEITHSKPLLFKKVSTKVDSDQITLTLESRGKLSEKFTPDTISLSAKLLPKHSLSRDSVKLTPIIYKVKAATTENGQHTQRNKNLVWFMIFALLLLIYLFALGTKARFKKGALLDYFTSQKVENTVLRKSGFASWLNRWFNPFCAEKREIIFGNVQKSILFVAKKTKYSIRIPQDNFDKSAMTYKEYSPNKRGYIEFVENRELKIKRENEFTAIKYDSVPAVKDDRPYFKIALWSISILVLLILILI